MLQKKDLLSLEGKVAVITGAAGGLGLGTAQLLSAYGAKVAMLDIQKETGEKEAEAINKAGRSAKFYVCDITDINACEKTIKSVESDFGKIDILFNNAGVAFRNTVVGLSEKEWDIVLDVTLKGAFLVSKFVVPIMEKNGGGSIINTGSGWGLKGGNLAAAYCAAKGGIVNLTRAMAIDHGSKNIRVNSVNPGDTDTAMLRSEGVQTGDTDGVTDLEAYLEACGKDRPLGRLGTPEDVANTVLFLASDMSSWVTGAAIVVDGGGIA